MNPVLSVRAALRWWLKDPDPVPTRPTMLPVRFGRRYGDDAVTVTPLESLPPRGEVVFCGVLMPAADRVVVLGMLHALVGFAERWAPDRWAVYVTNGPLPAYARWDSAGPPLLGPAATAAVSTPPGR